MEGRKAGCVSRTCGTCERSWDDRAVFCGACGALLDAQARSTVRRHGDPSAWWRRPGVVGVGVTVAVVGVVAAVPSLSIDRVPPVEGEIGVPETEDLRTAPDDVRLRRSVEPPEVTCLGIDVELDCVAWSRRLASPPQPTGEGGSWVMVTGDRLLLVGETRLDVVDATTGTRLWHRDGPTWPMHPVGATDDTVMLGGALRSVVLDIDAGTERWSMDGDTMVWHTPATPDMVITGRDVMGETPTIVAHAAADGETLWEWPSPWRAFDVVDAGRSDRLVVVSEGNGLAVLESATGREVGRSDVPAEWFLGGVDDVAVAADVPDEFFSGEMDHTVPPEATLYAIDLDDGSELWHRTVPFMDGRVHTVGSLVMAVTEDGLTALDASTGEPAWGLPTDGFVDVAGHSWFHPVPPPTQTPSVVVTIEYPHGVVRGHDPTTGMELWRQEAEAVEHAFIEGRHVVVSAAGDYRWLDATSGREVFRVRAHGMWIAGITDDGVVLHHQESGQVTHVDLPGAITS